MTEERLKQLLDELCRLPGETEWVEFKVNYVKHEEIGKDISALSNSACLHDKKNTYLVFGIENETHNVVGTAFKPKHYKVGSEELENWLARLLKPRIDFKIYEFKYSNKLMVIFEIDPTHHTPVKFKNTAYIRVGSYTKKLSDFPEKERKIWKKQTIYDWSAQICKNAAVDDLDPEAVSKARKEYKQKYPQQAEEVDKWNDLTFLNKAKVTIRNKITNAAIVLLGKNESEHFISPSTAKMTWILRNEKNETKDYEHFGPPFVLNTDRVLAKIRNLKYRYLPDGTLFPIEINQYEPYVIREALHNCIAHQDYELRDTVTVEEKSDELIFINSGSFIPGTVESVIQQNAPQKQRNGFLANAMLNLGMIDVIGSGIVRMFNMQKERFFPLPDYDLSAPDKVRVTIFGKVLNENYTQLLIKNRNMDLSTVILLDKVQKNTRISKDEHKRLKSKKLVEGRYPNLFVSSYIAAATEEKAKYIKYRGFDDHHYKESIIDFIEKFGSAKRKDINDLLLKHLSDALDEKQKRNKISNLLYAMSKTDKTIKNNGSRREPKWVLCQTEADGV
jgi:ATP-dependent DNA helicase RecG